MWGLEQQMTGVEKSASPGTGLCLDTLFCPVKGHLLHREYIYIYIYIFYFYIFFIYILLYVWMLVRQIRETLQK